MSTPIIETNKLCKTFSSDGVQQHILRNLDLKINDGDFTVIMGPSGAGKSTLLYALSGMDKPTLGQIVFDGEDISQMSDDKLAVFRRSHCGFVFQQFFLMDNMSLMDNVLASGRLMKKDRKELVQRAEQLFQQVGIEKTLWSKFPGQISGGEAQRAGIVRALINRPSVVFADEPTGALNSATGAAVLDALEVVHLRGQSVVMVTHDLTSALRGNRILYLRDGAICGELALTGDSDTKREILRDFLVEMGW